MNLLQYGLLVTRRDQQMRMRLLAGGRETSSHKDYQQSREGKMLQTEA
jgi:hypothetical protein